MNFLSLPIKYFWMLSLPFIILLILVTCLSCFIKIKGGKSILLPYWISLFKLFFYSLIVWGTLYIDGESRTIQLRGQLMIGDYLLIIVSSLEIISSLISIYEIYSNDKTEINSKIQEDKICGLENRVRELEIITIKLTKK